MYLWIEVHEITKYGFIYQSDSSGNHSILYGFTFDKRRYASEFYLQCET